DQGCRIRGIAAYRMHAFAADFFDVFAVLLNHHEGDVPARQRATDAPADAAVADDDHLTFQVFALGTHRQHREWVFAVFQLAGEGRATQRPGLERLDEAEHHRVQGNGNQRAGQYQAH